MRQAFGDEGGHDKLRDRCEIVRFGVEGPVIAVGLLVGVEPGLGVKGFCLHSSVSALYWPLDGRGKGKYLSHIAKELLPTPPLQLPIVKILLAPADAERAIAPATPA